MKTSYLVPKVPGIESHGLIVSLFLSLAPPLLQAQNLVPSGTFFDPDFEARRPGGTAGLDLTFNSTLYDGGTQSAGPVSWNLQAGGLVQVGLSVDVGLLEVPVADVQLAAFTATSGDSLVFGRELELNNLGGVLPATLNTLANQALGTSLVNAWGATSTVGSLSLTGGQTYRVGFALDTGSGLDLAALTAASFALSSSGTPLSSTGGVTLLNLLNLLTIGGGSCTVAFDFIAPASLNTLTFDFDAAATADLAILGGISGNQTFLQFTDFSMTPVPEPGSALLFLLAGAGPMLRRRRRH